MDTTAIIEIISTLGFPIACVIALGVFVFMLWKQSKERETKLYEEIGACRSINAKAIETLTLYAERLGVIESDVKDIKDDIATLTK